MSAFLVDASAAGVAAGGGAPGHGQAGGVLGRWVPVVMLAVGSQSSGNSSRLPAHVMEYSARSAATMGAGAGPLQFVGPLRVLNGDERWCVVLYALPPGKAYEDIAGAVTPEYLQASGSADRMVLEIRKPGGEQWGVGWVRYVIGHPHQGAPPLDDAIALPPPPR